MAEAREAADRFGVRGESRKKNEWAKSDPDPERSGVQDVEAADNLMAMTPTVTTDAASLARGSARPTTRSMTSPGDVLMALSYDNTSSGGTRIRSPMKALPTLNLSALEDSKSNVTYDPEEKVNDPEDDNLDAETRDQDRPLESPTLLNHSTKKPEAGQPSGRPARLCKQKATQNPQGLALTVQKRAKRWTLKADAGWGLRKLRRSPRLAKPLTEFHLFDKLPPEIKLMIWEFAIKPRLTYVGNRPSVHNTMTMFGRHNPYPKWFMTCRLSAWVARNNYQKRFGIQTPNYILNVWSGRDFNSANDIVIFEPCHSACRGCHCARRRYSDADRSAVRFLAVQTESPTLSAYIPPCWISVTRSWPNVEILYLMRAAITGTNWEGNAMIRVLPTAFELELQKRFQEWKKNDGKEVKVRKLEFVVVVPKEITTTKPDERYRSVKERLTGRPEDIILE
ncbi:hypothetical protein F5Y05DRAFT_45109 [Hypoxylon sp. FL0543]|nr:hypothetical protein F5Y05DRAFT_45109 [Hypoxylon sp. FL0543]